MKINGKAYRTIWMADDGASVTIIDQTKLPHLFETVDMTTAQDAYRAIKDMLVRGAPLIGVTAAYGVALAMRADTSDAALQKTCEYLNTARPTAINLRWALDDMQASLMGVPASDRVDAAYTRAHKMADDDAEANRMIGVHGVELIRNIAAKKDGPINILTHCNAGWLATVDWGTATSPIYHAFNEGIDVHVWVDETRPRNQGGALTAFELGHHGVPHSVIVDNAGGHLMQHGLVDMCIVGTDRTTRTGDVCNKIGTYLKAVAAADNDIPFYVTLPGSTVDWTLDDGFDIPIEERDGEEVTHVWGETDDGRYERVRVVAKGSPARNYAFDVTPAKYVTSLVTERGVCDASLEGLSALYPEKAK